MSLKLSVEEVNNFEGKLKNLLEFRQTKALDNVSKKHHLKFNKEFKFLAAKTQLYKS